MRYFNKLIKILFFEKRLPWFLKKRMSVKWCIRALTLLLFKLIRITRNVVSDNTSSYEVCTLLDKANIDCYLVTIKSFVMNSPFNCKITVVSDGSLGEVEFNILRKNIKGVNIYLPININDPNDDLLMAMKEARNAYHTIRKTYDIYHVISSDVIIFLDSDVIIRKSLDKSIFDVNGDIELRYNRDHDHSVRDPLFYITERFVNEKGINTNIKITDLNCGFMVFSSKVFKMDLIMEYIMYLHQRFTFHTVMEQDCWNILASTISCEAMPDDYVVGDYGDDFIYRIRNRNPITVHYVGGIRYKTLDYLKDGLQVIIKAYKA